MKFHESNNIKHQGFTLIELMISLVIGLFILSGVMFTYMSMKSTTKSTLEIGEIQESGRLAMDIISKDIERAGFWGSYYGNTLDFNNVTVLANPGTDCSEGDNNASFPGNFPTNFRYIYGIETSSANALGCITNAVQNTDVIQMKGLGGNNIKGEASGVGRYYLITQKKSAQFRVGDGTVFNIADVNTNSTVWEYNHYVYFISLQTGQRVKGQEVDIPTLMRRRLSAENGGEFSEEVIMEGIENMRFVYGIDTNANDKVDTYRVAEQMQAIDWEQSNSKIMSVQIFLLVRSLQEDFSSPARNRTYTLGGVGNDTAKTLTFNDRFRRSVFVSTVRLVNGGSELW
ncbi:PilW family protein [Pseudoalteromonas denitrificans]|uniref:Type IV pilus assembly protein PilW n=1 Tax=Pseudoalteromonas denitrificans DSM 6059 TaxID=1123010 RepID=A0A1I1QRG2_9GAMM|nr:PilW family protein [Pseudoalteromonas denitrificans]SFD24649.1 type IV pilus assembly protein PilW [Pseudoalteromonas denitrificans DSM 6059]